MNNVGSLILITYDSIEGIDREDQRSREFSSVGHENSYSFIREESADISSTYAFDNKTAG